MIDNLLLLPQLCPRLLLPLLLLAP